MAARHDTALMPLNDDTDTHDSPDPVLRVRTAWISDLHLGTPGCQAEALLSIMRELE